MPIVIFQVAEHSEVIRMNNRMQWLVFMAALLSVLLVAVGCTAWARGAAPLPQPDRLGPSTPVIQQDVYGTGVRARVYSP